MKLTGTLEAFYSKLTGKPARWGNTGSIGRGSLAELPIVVCTLILVVSLVRSLVVFCLLETDSPIHNALPLWGYCFAMLDHYWPFARVSVQEFFSIPYGSLHAALFKQWFFGVALMGFTLVLMLREQSQL